MYLEMTEELSEEFTVLAEKKGYRRGHRWRWSINRVMADVGAVGTMDARVNGEGYDENWTVPQRTLVSIMRSERVSLRRAKEEELKRKYSVKNG